jgi:hypothetical protein
MHIALIVTAVGLICLCAGFLGGMLTAYLFVESILNFLDDRENPELEAAD